MHELMELKTKICRELEEYGAKPNIPKTEMEYIELLTSAAKNLGKIISTEDVMHSNRSYGNGRSYNDRSYGSYDDNSYDNMSYDDNSYARGRGRYAKRDSMGRYSSERGYSSEEDLMEQIKEMMRSAPEPKRQELRRMIETL